MTVPLRNLCAGNGATSALAEHVELLEARLTAEIARLDRKTCPARDGHSRCTCPSASHDVDLQRQLDEARAEIERLKALAAERYADVEELHAALGEPSQSWTSPIESRTADRIAAWLERRAADILAPNRHCVEAQQRAAGLSDAVDALRAGTWRGEL